MKCDRAAEGEIHADPHLAVVEEGHLGDGKGWFRAQRLEAPPWRRQQGGACNPTPAAIPAEEALIDPWVRGSKGIHGGLESKQMKNFFHCRIGATKSPRAWAAGSW